MQAQIGKNPAEHDSSELPQFASPRFHNVLLCTDFSYVSKAALHSAIQFCGSTQAKFTVLHVCEYGPMPVTSDEGFEHVQALLKKEYEQLQNAAKELRTRGLQAEAVTVDGSAAPVILNEIRERHIDLAVLGTTGAHGIERLLFGSTAEAIFRKAPCPVLTAGPKARTAENRDHVGPVVFATDFGEPSLGAFKVAAALAAASHVSLHCVHVVPVEAKHRDNANVPAMVQRALHELTKDLPAADTEPICTALYGSDTAHAIVEYSESCGAGLVVLGVHTRSRLSAHLPAQRTYRVIANAPCAVLTICSENSLWNAMDSTVI